MQDWRKRSSERGDFIEWLLMLLAISVVIFAILIPKHSPESFTGFPTEIPNAGLGTRPGNTSSSGEAYTSAYRNEIRLSRGSASREDNPDEEYITLRNTGNSSVNITGWTLGNARGRFVAVPKASLLLSPSGYSFSQDVILAPGEEAIVTTGKIGIGSYRLASFKVNKCVGYLGDLDKRYPFEPSISRQCPAPEEEPGVNALPKECREVIERMSACRNPEIGGHVDGDYCADCVDGVDVSNACVAFVESHYSYAGCVANHAADPDFYEDEWRLYLGEIWELWDENTDVIRLYDSSGNLVASQEY